MIHKKEVVVISILITLAFQTAVALAEPQITSWYNDNTTDDSTDLSIFSGTPIFFNVTANGSVDSWNWSVNGGAIVNNKSNLTYTFDSFGSYNVSVFASAGNQTTEEVVWDITSTLCITDDMDENVCLSERPERIVSLGPSNTEILFGVGAGDRVVGTTAYCDYPSEAADTYKVGDYSTLSQELIVNASPDLIFSAYGNDIDIINNLKDLDYAVIGLNPQDTDDVLSTIELVGKATQEEVNASLLISSMEDRIDAVTDVTGSLSEDERMGVLYVIWYDPIWVAGTDTYINDMLEKAGGKNVAGFSGWQVMNLESLLAASPEVIFCSDMGGYSGIREALMSNEIIQYTDAYLNNRIYTIYDPNLIERPGPRVVDGLEELYSFISSNASYVISSENPEVDLAADAVTRVRAQDIPDLILDVVSLDDSSSSFDIQSSSTPFGLNATFDNSLGKYVKINATNLDLGWAVLRVYYTDAELSAANLVESSLKMRRYNASSNEWVVLDEAMDWVSEVGISTESERGYSGYIWANVSHFSYYGVSGDNPAPPSPPPSSGGGGGAAPPTNLATATVKSIKAGEVAIFDFDEALSEVVSGIDLSVNGDAYNVRISVETLKGKAYSSMSDPKGLAYKYLKVSPSGISSSKIEKAEVKFRTERSWLEENDIDPATVEMTRNVRGNWEFLSTSKTGYDSEYSYYTAETPGFSYFAIVAEEGSGYAREVVLAPADTPAPTVPPTTEAPATTAPPPSETPAPTVHPAAETSVPVVAATTPPLSGTPAVISRPLSRLSMAVIGGSVLLAIWVAAFILNRRDLY